MRSEVVASTAGMREGRSKVRARSFLLACGVLKVLWQIDYRAELGRDEMEATGSKMEGECETDCPLMSAKG